ncbi:hypothetical protein HS125_16565 [bacterium]|nr:hypothetical protein [bacterium]
MFRLLCSTLFVICLPVALSQEFAGLLRDEMALGLRPTAASAGMGGAYVGVAGPDSMNPAALGAMEGWQALFQYLHTGWDDAPDADNLRADLFVPVPRIGGTLRLMVEGYESDDYELTRLGLETEFQSRTLGFQYGRTILDERLRIGLGGYPYEKAEIDFRVPGGPKALSGDAFSQIGSLDGGVQFDVCKYATLGLRGIYIIDELDGTLYPPATGGPKVDVGDHDYYIHYLAPGVALRPFEGTLVAIDYWNGEIEGHAADDSHFDMDVDRWSFGVEQRLFEDRLILRAGGWNGGFTAGIGTRLLEGRLSLDYAFVDEAYNDISDVFGDAESHYATVKWSW